MMGPLMSEPTQWQATEAEWTQAWNQVRHFETMRGQWLGFFFTVTIGVLAFAGPRVDSNDSQSLAMVAVIALTLEVFSCALYLVVSRLNEVHTYNDSIIYETRRRMNEVSKLFAGKVSAFPPDPPRRGRAGNIGTTKGASEYVLWGSAVVFVALLAATAVRAWTAAGITGAAECWCLLTATVSVLLVVGTTWLRFPGRTSSTFDEPAGADDEDRSAKEGMSDSRIPPAERIRP